MKKEFIGVKLTPSNVDISLNYYWLWKCGFN